VCERGDKIDVTMILLGSVAKCVAIYKRCGVFLQGAIGLGLRRPYTRRPRSHLGGRMVMGGLQGAGGMMC
jgi:hypothetical protein